MVDLVGSLIVGVVMRRSAPCRGCFSLQWPLAGSLPRVVRRIVVDRALALTPRRVRAIGYQLRDDDLLFRRGIMFQRFVAVPYGRMQLVDINRGPLARALGLTELKFVTAAAASGVDDPRAARGRRRGAARPARRARREPPGRAVTEPSGSARGSRGRAESTSPTASGTGCTRRPRCSGAASRSSRSSAS